ncbi:hypothetical protein Ddc_20385 [Ditylenchus destructor]|nr:hypothetical protein Ddc_20385 [Ditylenchus destructor]
MEFHRGFRRGAYLADLPPVLPSEAQRSISSSVGVKRLPARLIRRLTALGTKYGPLTIYLGLSLVLSFFIGGRPGRRGKTARRLRCSGARREIAHVIRRSAPDHRRPSAPRQHGSRGYRYALTGGDQLGIAGALLDRAGLPALETHTMLGQGGDDVIEMGQDLVRGSLVLLLQSKTDNNGGRQGGDAGDAEGQGRPQQVPAIAGIQGAQCATGAGQRCIQRLALTLLPVAKTTLHEGNRRRMKAAEGNSPAAPGVPKSGGCGSWQGTSALQPPRPTPTSRSHHGCSPDVRGAGLRIRHPHAGADDAGHDHHDYHWVDVQAQPVEQAALITTVREGDHFELRQHRVPEERVQGHDQGEPGIRVADEDQRKTRQVAQPAPQVGRHAAHQHGDGHQLADARAGEAQVVEVQRQEWRRRPQKGEVEQIEAGEAPVWEGRSHDCGCFAAQREPARHHSTLALSSRSSQLAHTGVLTRTSAFCPRDRRSTDADARIVAPLGDHVHRVAVHIDRTARRGDARRRLERQVRHNRLAGGNTPKMPPALLLRKPSGSARRGVRCRAGTHRQSRANFHAFHRVDAHQRMGQFSVEAVEDRFARPGFHAFGDHGDLGTDGVLVAAQLVHIGFQFRHLVRVGAEEALSSTLSQVLNGISIGPSWLM